MERIGIELKVNDWYKLKRELFEHIITQSLSICTLYNGLPYFLMYSNVWKVKSQFWISVWEKFSPFSRLRTALKAERLLFVEWSPGQKWSVTTESLNINSIYWWICLLPDLFKFAWSFHQKLVSHCFLFQETKEEGMSFKVLGLQNFSIYWDNDAAPLGNLPHSALKVSIELKHQFFHWKWLLPVE